MYYPDEYKSIEPWFLNKLNTKSKYDLYILLKPDCDAVQDGTRQFLEERESHYNEIKNQLIERRLNFVEIGGTWEERYQQSIDKIDKLIINI